MGTDYLVRTCGSLGTVTFLRRGAAFCAAAISHPANRKTHPAVGKENRALVEAMGHKTVQHITNSMACWGARVGERCRAPALSQHTTVAAKAARPRRPAVVAT